jgi:hypothetical protein
VSTAVPIPMKTVANTRIGSSSGCLYVNTDSDAKSGRTFVHAVGIFSDSGCNDCSIGTSDEENPRTIGANAASSDDKQPNRVAIELPFRAGYERPWSQPNQAYVGTFFTLSQQRSRPTLLSSYHC